MQASAERDAMTDSDGAMKDMIKSLETELQSSSASLSTANADVTRYRSKVTQLQALLESAEKSRQTEQLTRKKQVSDVSEAKLNVSRLNSKMSTYLYSHQYPRVFVYSCVIV